MSSHIHFVCSRLSDCVFDLCAESGSAELRCASYEAYAAACQEAGVKLGSWRQQLDCGKMLIIESVGTVDIPPLIFVYLVKMIRQGCDVCVSVFQFSPVLPTAPTLTACLPARPPALTWQHPLSVM